MSTPQWCQAFVLRAWQVLEGPGYPTIVYRVAKDTTQLSGRAWVEERRITLTIGKHTLLRDRQALVLHELVHLVLPAKTHHARAFYERLFDAAKALGLTAPVLKGESWYKGMASQVAKERGIRGARQAAAKYQRKAERRRTAWCPLGAECPFADGYQGGVWTPRRERHRHQVGTTIHAADGRWVGV